VVARGNRPPHQLPRIAGNNTGSTVICKRQIQTKHPAKDQQHHSSGLYQSSGGYNLQRASKDSVDVVPGEEYTYHSPASQNTIADAESWAQIDRTDWKLSPLIFHRIQETDLFATRLSAQCLRYFSWRPDSSAEAPPSVDSHQRVSQPSVELDRQDTCSITNSTSQHSAGSTSVEIATMVPHTPTLVSGLPQADNVRCQNNGEPGRLSDAPTVSRMAHLREKYRGQQLSEEATDLMLNS